MLFIILFLAAFSCKIFDSIHVSMKININICGSVQYVQLVILNFICNSKNNHQCVLMRLPSIRFPLF